MRSLYSSSSIHEVILIPAYDHDSYDELTSMVKEVNSTQLSKEEILSDHVYFYSRETGQILCDHFYVTLFKIGKFFV